jgi:hypothetical protein
VEIRDMWGDDIGIPHDVNELNRALIRNPHFLIDLSELRRVH